MKFIKKKICEEQKQERLRYLPKFKTSAGLAPDISSASTVASGIELTDLQIIIKKGT